MSNANAILPYGRHCIEDDDVAAVTAVLRGDWLTTGPAVDAFEQRLAERVGARHAVACSSGTAALHLAALAAGLEPSQHAIVPSMTFSATANGARYTGAEIAFSDVDPDTGLMRAVDLEAALRERRDTTPAAVFPVHLAGQVTDMAAIHDVARAQGLRIVEDASHAIGARYRAGPDGEWLDVGCCRHSDMTVFSFHPVKSIAMGEGGAITTNDPALDARLRDLRTHGLTRDAERFEDREAAFDESGTVNPWYYELQELGFNYRASDIHCALGHSQLGKLDRFIARRSELVGLYDAAIGRLAPHLKPLPRIVDCMPAWHLYVVLIDFAAAGIGRGDTMRKLREFGIQTQVHYIPVHRQPYYRQRYGTPDLPGTGRYYERTLSLPLFPDMADSDVTRVIEALATVLDV